MLLATAALLASFVVPVVWGHGYVPIIRVNGVEYKGWDVTSDPYSTPPVRQYFILTVTTHAHLTRCGTGGKGRQANPK